MKKTLLTLAIATTLVACSKTTVEYEQTGAISLRPVANIPMGKVITGPIGTTYNANEAFIVYAWHKIDGLQGGEGWTAFYGDGTGLAQWIDNGKFIATGTGNQWGGSPAYYWPKTGYLMFAGYSPAEIVKPATTGQATAESAAYNIGKTPEFILTGFQQGSWIASNNSNMIDLMWFNIDDAESKAVNNAANSTAVAVKFHHALSWLTFNFETANTTGTSTPKFFLTEAKLTQVKTKGNLSGKQTGATWTVHSMPQDYILHSNATGTELSTTLTADNILAIPYDFTTASKGEYELVIKFKQGGTDQLEQTATLSLNMQANKVWEAGKHYTYTVKMSANPIILEPGIDAWNNVTGGDLNIN